MNAPVCCAVSLVGRDATVLSRHVVEQSKSDWLNNHTGPGSANFTPPSALMSVNSSFDAHPYQYSSATGYSVALNPTRTPASATGVRSSTAGHNALSSSRVLPNTEVYAARQKSQDKKGQRNSTSSTGKSLSTPQPRWRTRSPRHGCSPKHAEASEIGLSLSLHNASANGDLVEVGHLIRGKVDLNKVDMLSGATPLHCACDRNQVAVVAALVGARAYLGARTDRDGWTALHHACAHADILAVKYLVTAKADVNAQAFSGLQPLDIVAVRQRADVVNYLLNNGAASSSSLSQQWSVNGSRTTDDSGRVTMRTARNFEVQSAMEDAGQPVLMAHQKSLAGPGANTVSVTLQNVPIVASFGGQSDAATTRQQAGDERLRDARWERAVKHLNDHPNNQQPTRGRPNGFLELEKEIATLGSNNEILREANRTLRSQNETLSAESKDLRATIQTQQHEIAALRDFVEGLKANNARNFRNSLSTKAAKEGLPKHKGNVTRTAPGVRERADRRPKSQSNRRRKQRQIRNQQQQHRGKTHNPTAQVQSHVVHQSILPPWLRGIEPNDLDPRWTALTDQQRSMIRRALKRKKKKVVAGTANATQRASGVDRNGGAETPNSQWRRKVLRNTTSGSHGERY